MRNLKVARYLIVVLAASVLTAGLLAGCGGSGNSSGSDVGNVGSVGNGGNGGNVDSNGGGGNVDSNGGGGNVDSNGGGGSVDSNGGGGSSSVTGTVTWPDGHPAANASVYFNNHETGFNGSGWSQHDSANSWYQVQQLPADGSYSLPGCPCGDLTAYLLVPSAVMSPANGGWDCWIIMQDDNQNYSGLQANPGDVINWQALNLACSPTFYTSDQPTVQSEATTVLPSLNSGPWQNAEQLTSGGGSS